MPNSVVPALQFNPVPVGFIPLDKTDNFKITKTVTVSLPSNLLWTGNEKYIMTTSVPK
jgi:hypothetical protein